MKLEINDVEETAYQNFIDSIRDKETFRKYNSYLKLFLDLIPNEMYKQYLQHEPTKTKTPVIPNIPSVTLIWYLAFSSSDIV